MKLLQIDSCLGILSTGKITESIATIARVKGWDTYIAHGARAVGPTKQEHYQITTKAEEYVHYAFSVLFDRHGLHCTSATKKLIRWIEEIKPDIIHLHCIHGYHLNYKVLFDYINQLDIPIVWTFHDCWAFTGHCAYFDSVDCTKWLTQCHNCELKSDYPKSIGFDRSSRNYDIKKNLFCSTKNLTIVGVSDWISNLTKKSFLGNRDIITIHNGTDLNVFYPVDKKERSDKFRILGVAAVWDSRKGLEDFISLRQKLSIEEYDIILVGLSKEQVSKLPAGIIGLTRTTDVGELRQLYSDADVFVNPTYSDNFPTTNIEALACGTPVITYDTGGSPEAVDESTGVVVKKGDIQAIYNAILKLATNNKIKENCVKRATLNFNKDDKFNEYIMLYNRLLIQMRGGVKHRILCSVFYKSCSSYLIQNNAA